MKEENPKNKKSKKDVKWYTYVDSELDHKLKEFMEEHSLKKQAQIIRDCVNYYIDYVKYVMQKPFEKREYDNIYINNYIKEAIDLHEINKTLYEELKQKLSPLKVSILMLNNLLEDPDKLKEGIENIKLALQQLEDSIKRRFEEPKIIRHLKKFDILYIEDNELERKTIETYFKRKKGLDVKAIETSEEGLEILKDFTPRAFLIDIDLKTSNINGDRLCQILKSNAQYKSIPTILISALVSENEKKDILKSTGADDIIIKPIDKLADLDILLEYLK
ncbi:MAG: PleD family two-component system response regulator [Promethearchaeota archaeon]